MKLLKKIKKSVLEMRLINSLTVSIFLLVPCVNFAQAPNLGAASGFALFTAVGALGNVGATHVKGDIGSNSAAVTGFPTPGTVVGTIHNPPEATLSQAATDVGLAYGYLSTLGGVVLGTTLVDAQVLTPGVYNTGGASTLNGNLILDGQNNPNALFIIRIGGAFSTSISSTITLIHSASVRNVYWQINGQFDLGDNSVFRGTIVANGAINLLEGSTLFGRGLSQAGAIALHNNIVNIGPPIWTGFTNTDWNTTTNWSTYFVPTALDDATIPSVTNQPLVNQNPGTPAICKNIMIESGAVVTIAAGKALTVIDSLTNNNAGGVVIQSDGTNGTGSLITGTVLGTGSATVQRYISGSAEAWHFLSSPVDAQSISGSWLPSGTYGNDTGYDLYVWNEPTNCWIYKLDVTSVVNWNTVHSGANFIVGRGYLYSVQATNPTKEFTGNLNNGAVSYGLTSGSSDVNLIGFNLVGNPYPSSVDWQAASGWTRTNLVSSGGGYDIWIWNPTANNYGVFNSATGTGTNGITRYIAPMQGFFVKAASAGNLSMDNTVRVHDVAMNWKSAVINPDMLSIIVQSAPNNGFDEVRLLFGYAANQSGATKLFSQVVTAPSLYLTSGSKNYSVRYLTDTTENAIVPLKFKPGQDGNYTLQFNFDVDKFKVAILEDRQTKTIQNLKIGQTYSFKALKTDDVNRFVLHFGSDLKHADNELPAKIYTDGSNLIIDLLSVSTETYAYVYDIMGRKLLEQKFQGETQHTLKLKTGSPIIIVQLINKQGRICRKLFCNNN